MGKGEGEVMQRAPMVSEERRGAVRRVVRDPANAKRAVPRSSRANDEEG